MTGGLPTRDGVRFSAAVRGDLRDPAGLAVLRRGGHRPDADVHVRARHGAADLRRHRPVRAGGHRVGGRRRSATRSARRSSRGWPTPARPAPGAASRCCVIFTAGDRRPCSRRSAARCPTGRCSARRDRGGATMPQLGPWPGPAGRFCWRARRALHTAFSFESVADELCFVIGPAAVTLLATEVHPAAGVACAALLCLGGTLWFAAQRRTEPAVVRAAPARRPAGPAGPRRRAARVRREAAAPGLVVLVPGVPVARRDVRVGRPEHGRVCPALRAQAAGRAHPRQLRPRQRDRRALVRVPAVAGARREQVRPDPGPDRAWAWPRSGPSRTCSR